MRRAWSGASRILGGLAASLALVVLLGLAWQRHAVRADARQFPPPGRLVDVGGLRLHLHCTGRARPDTPIVVLEALAGGSSVYWGWVQPALAARVRVCSYDRAGFGWSDPAPMPTSHRQSVAALHALLRRAGELPPYVLVGHSKGGIIVRGYQRDYPDEVRGMVLVDAAHPLQFRRFPQLLQDSERERQTICILPVAAELGLMRLVLAAGGSFDFGSLRAPERAALQAFWSSPKHWRSICAELQALTSVEPDAESLGSMGDLPLAVITAGDNRALGWQQLQSELPALSRRSSHTVVAGASHVSLVFDREQATTVSGLILSVLD